MVQRDVKIGLSLGLLLVVVVAALFFRRDAERPAGPPALEDADGINRQIAERDRSPYTLGDPEEFETPAASPAPPPSARSDAERPRLKGVLASDDEALHDRLLSGSRTSVPDPIRTAAPPATRQPADAVPLSAPSGDGTRTHIIRPGDTLSGLAQKYLGSSARYQDLFDANSAVLRNPNRLPEGVTIVIPPRERRAADQSALAVEKPAKSPDAAASPPAAPARAPGEPARANTAREPERPAAKGDSTESRKLFKPSRRPPFASNRTLPQRKSDAAQDVKVPPAGDPAGPATEPKPQTGSPESSLPRIDVNDGTDFAPPN